MNQNNIQQQLIREHASLIIEVVAACANADKRHKLLADLLVAEQNGWGNLVAAIRLILAGELELENLGNLDPEDEIIIISILNAIADPSYLPSSASNDNPILAPSGIAGIIKDAATGNENALRMLAMMDADLARSQQPELQKFGKILRRLLNGERHMESLCMGLNQRTASLVRAVLSELADYGI